MHLSGEELVHRCHHVSVQIQRCFVVVFVGSAFITLLCQLQVCMRNVQSWGFILSEHGRGPLRDVTGWVWPRW